MATKTVSYQTTWLQQPTVMHTNIIFYTGWWNWIWMFILWTPITEWECQSANPDISLNITKREVGEEGKGKERHGPRLADSVSSKLVVATCRKMIHCVYAIGVAEVPAFVCLHSSLQSFDWGRDGSQVCEIFTEGVVQNDGHYGCNPAIKSHK